MLVIRLQRTGRKGHAQFRVVVQDSRRTPTSGKIVAALGNYNPHTKESKLDKEKAAFYLEHGAQPSERAARLLKAEGVKLPKWVVLDSSAKRAIRNPEKRRSTRPAEPEEAPTPAEEPTPETASEEPITTDKAAEPARAESQEPEVTAEASAEDAKEQEAA